MGNGTTTRPDMTELLRVLHLAWSDRAKSEARWKDAVADLRRHDARCMEAEIAVERASRG